MHKKGVSLKKNVLRSKIKSLLFSPKTVTELKKELPEVSSLGTLAYHLKMLREKGDIGTYKLKHKQGSPTYYYAKTIRNVALFQENPLELAGKETATREEWKKEILNFVSKKNTPVLTEDLIDVIIKYEKINNEEFLYGSIGYVDIFYEVLQDLTEDDLLGYTITKDGRNYIEK